MITKRLSGVITSLAMGFALLIFTSPLSAQTKNYPVATVASSNGTLNTNVTTPANAGGSDLTNAARISSSLLSNGNYVQVNWGTTAVGATPVYIKVNAESTLLQGVLGGSLGNLVGNLVAAA